VIRHRCVVSSNEFIRPEWCSDADLLPPWHAHIEADIAVAVSVLDEVLETNLHEGPIIYAAISSHGFIDPSLLGRAANAASSSNLSQIVRELMRLGGGIRPSFTRVSNREGETPT
jgi:hypothetical protein